jgi:queuine tRNA-ribosyltransferase-like protein
MRILVITSCTGDKAVAPKKALTVEDFARGGAHLKKRERELAGLMRKSEELYTGQQHVRLMRGVRAIRDLSSRNGSLLNLDLWVLSAGYGLVPGDRKLAPYECTFQGMKSRDLRARADSLKVPLQFRDLVATKYDLGLILLGDSYLSACRIDDTIEFGGPTLLFCGSGVASRLPLLPFLRPVILSNRETTVFSCALVGLKGEVAARLLSQIADGRIDCAEAFDSKTDILARLKKTTGNGQAPLRVQAIANPLLDRVIEIPEHWWQRPHRENLRYFIPEWDDQVDPEYDFEKDIHSGGSGNWSNQVYAHQLLPWPAYDGILISRIVAEKSKKKKTLINKTGVHRYLRVPRRFPVMGDCGAFGYIGEKEPPYTTEDVLDYYSRLDFDFGVSVDHLIVAATVADKHFRYDLTIQNAADFIKEHKKRKLSWVPIGAVQGWDADSYVKAAKKYVQMGYKYLALGGLVRTPTQQIVQIIREVRKVIPGDVQLHLFGVARLQTISRFAELGLNSVDSSSMLRKAWLGSERNYLTADGWYSAIRVPQADRCFRAKKLVQEQAISSDQLARLEQACLRGLRKYAASASSPSKSLLDLLVEYDTLVAGSRQGTNARIRRTLADRPWEKCSCSICKKNGIEVVIFRGNNRNRRRGFHNTFIFYDLFQRAVQGEYLSEHDASVDDVQPGLFDGLENDE